MDAKIEKFTVAYRITHADGSEEMVVPVGSVTAPPPPPPKPEPEPLPARNPFTKKFYNLTLQAKLKKENPKEYERLKTLALAAD